MSKLSFSHLLKIWRYLRDPQKPRLPKIVAIAALLYLVWPADAIPDVIPVLGWLDDLGLAALAFWYISRVVDRG